MTDRIAFEARLEARLLARAENAVLPFDASAIARRALERPNRRSDLALGWRSLPRGLRWSLIALAIAGSVAGSLAFGAPLLQPSPAPTTVSNGWVAFAVKGFERVSNSDIWVVRSGSGDRPLIGSDDDELVQDCPSFSPDGSLLAYSRHPLGQSVHLGDVVVVPFGATLGQVGDERVPAPALGSGCPEWSPDGQRIAVAIDGQIWIIGLDGTATQLTAPPTGGGAGSFDWSPDGTEIATVVSNRLIAVRLNGGQQRVLREEEADVELSRPMWSPDGTRIAVEAFRHVPDGEGVRLDGLPPRIVTVDGSAAPLELPDANVDSPSWSPDGMRIAYARTRLDEHGLTKREIVVTAFDGSELHVLAAETRHIRGVAWSPDGQQVLYIADGAGGSLVTVASSGSSIPVALSGPHLFYNATEDDISWQPLFTPGSSPAPPPTPDNAALPTFLPSALGVHEWPGARGDQGPGWYSWDMASSAWMHNETATLHLAFGPWWFAPGLDA